MTVDPGGVTAIGGRVRIDALRDLRDEAPHVISSHITLSVAKVFMTRPGFDIDCRLSLARSSTARNNPALAVWPPGLEEPALRCGFRLPQSYRTPASSEGVVGAAVAHTTVCVVGRGRRFDDSFGLFVIHGHRHRFDD